MDVRSISSNTQLETIYVWVFGIDQKIIADVCIINQRMAVASPMCLVSHPTFQEHVPLCPHLTCKCGTHTGVNKK